MKKLNLLDQSASFKVNDTGTNIPFNAFEDKQPFGVDENDTSIFRIKNDIGFLKSVNATTTTGGYIFQLNTKDLVGLVPGTYEIELAVTDTQSNEELIFPDTGFCTFTISESALTITGTQIPTMSLDSFKQQLEQYVQTQTNGRLNSIEADFKKYVDSVKQGPAGPQGNPGEQGVPGQKGDPGESATVTVGTTTLGGAAKVTNSGTETNAVLDFVLPNLLSNAAAIDLNTSVINEKISNLNNVSNGIYIFNSWDSHYSNLGNFPKEAIDSFGNLLQLPFACGVDNQDRLQIICLNNGNILMRTQVQGGWSSWTDLTGTNSGTAPTIRIGNVNTVDSSEPASVINSGTSSNVVLDFNIPKGPQGPKGDKGDPGKSALTNVYNIENYGAKSGDSNFDNAVAFNNIMSILPNEGGTILIPVGDYYVKSPIKINHSFVRIKGTQNGWRSGVDQPNSNGANNGGSTLHCVGDIDVFDCQSIDNKRITGLTFDNFNIVGTNSIGTGINVKSDNDHCSIFNMVFKNLESPIIIKGPDALDVHDNIIAENKNGIFLLGASQQAQILDNSIGGQPGGISVYMENPAMFNITGNNIFPDASQNIKLLNPVHGVISGNSLTSYNNAIVDILPNSNGDLGNANTIASNQITVNKFDGTYGTDSAYGVIHIEGYRNLVASNVLEMSMPTNSTGVFIAKGDNNRVTSCIIDDSEGNSNKVVVDKNCNNTVIVETCRKGEYSLGNDNTNFCVELPS